MWGKKSVLESRILNSLKFWEWNDYALLHMDCLRWYVLWLLGYNLFYWVAFDLLTMYGMWTMLNNIMLWGDIFVFNYGEGEPSLSSVLQWLGHLKIV
jgi:hypothetical protein